VGILLHRWLQTPCEGVICVVHCRLTDVLQVLLFALRGGPAGCCVPGCHSLPWVHPRGARVHPVGPCARRKGLCAEATLVSPPKSLTHHAVKRPLVRPFELWERCAWGECPLLVAPQAWAHAQAGHPPGHGPTLILQKPLGGGLDGVLQHTQPLPKAPHRWVYQHGRPRPH
jgi:hypothetical protein